jgi:uncharacterized protein
MRSMDMEHRMYKWMPQIFVAGMVMVASACAVQIGDQSIRQTFTDKKVVELTEAAVADNAEEVAQLAKTGIDVNVIGRNGTTPLMWALYARKRQGTEALLRAGANPNLVMPIKNSHGEDIPHTAMYYVSQGEDAELLRLLLQHGGNPNDADDGKVRNRPLSLAATEGRIHNMQLLIAAGADVNAHDEFDDSAAENAIGARAKYEGVALLLEHGYRFNLQRLAKSVSIRRVAPENGQYSWREKVIAMLKERGVEVPERIRK